MKGLVFIKKVIINILLSIIVLFLSILLTAFLIKESTLLIKYIGIGYIYITIRIVLQILIGVFIELSYFALREKSINKMFSSWKVLIIPGLISIFMAFYPLIMSFSNYNISIHHYLIQDPFMFSFVGSVWLGLNIVKLVASKLMRGKSEVS